MVCTEQREALSAFHGCSSALCRKVGWGACKPPARSSHWSCSADSPSSSQLLPQQKSLVRMETQPRATQGWEREGGFTTSCKQGWENWPGVMGWASRGQLHPGFAALYSLCKEKKPAGTPESATVGTRQSSPVLPGGIPFQKGGRNREWLLENPGC